MLQCACLAACDNRNRNDILECVFLPVCDNNNHNDMLAFHRSQDCAESPRSIIPTVHPETKLNSKHRTQPQTWHLQSHRPRQEPPCEMTTIGIQNELCHIGLHDNCHGLRGHRCDGWNALRPLEVTILNHPERCSTNVPNHHDKHRQRTHLWLHDCIRNLLQGCNYESSNSCMALHQL